MTCGELQVSLLDNEDGSAAAQQAHLKNCPQCAALVADLLVIACTASELRGLHEPSPRVWNSIEAALRREQLIRPQHRQSSLLPSFASSWGWGRWALPVAAALLITIGVVVRQNSPSHELAHNNYASRPAVANTTLDASVAGLDDDDLLAEIAQQAPALQAQYSENLRHVNQYIQDAKDSVAANPNDEEAHRALMEAYQEKAMLFELALDRSLP